MSYVSKWKGKYVNFNSSDPSAIGQCADSGFIFNHHDLVKQMEWRGDRLVWTGFLRGKPYIDTPQEQSRPPLVKADPVPIKDPRIIQTGQPATFARTPGQVAPQDPPFHTDPNTPAAAPYDQLVAKLEAYNWNS